MNKKVLTLCVVHQDGKVLLGMKKKGFGMGKWNGFGGKVEAGETVEAAARRELQEEAGIDVTTLEKAGMMLCDIAGEPFVREVHVFRGAGVLGEPVESDEMLPRWFEAAALPFAQMWQSDVTWFPLFLEGKSFRSTIAFDAKHTLLSHAVEPL